MNSVYVTQDGTASLVKIGTALMDARKKACAFTVNAIVKRDSRARIVQSLLVLMNALTKENVSMDFASVIKAGAAMTVQNASAPMNALSTVNVILLRINANVNMDIPQMTVLWSNVLMTAAVMACAKTVFAYAPPNFLVKNANITNARKIVPAMVTV
jgi:hypothetical protein